MKPPMEPLVDTLIEDARWEGLDLPALANRAASETLAALGLPSAGLSVCVMGCDDARIAVLNADFRGKSQPTNVLSWPSEMRVTEPGDVPHPPQTGDADDPESLGDIALAWETCVAEADARGIPRADHASHLIIHGLLHCLGYDHEHESDAALMEGTEVRILASLGLPDPYGMAESPGADIRAATR